MTQFLYYVPELAARPTGETLSGLDLVARFPDGNTIFAPVTGGPDGKHGAIVASDAVGAVYVPDRQTWQRCHHWWLGWNKATPPGPADLVRRDTLPGLPFRLADGHEWVVPVAELRPKIEVFRDGAWRLEADPRHDALWAFAEKVREETWEPINEALMAWAAALSGIQEAEDADKVIALATQTHAAFLAAVAALSPSIAVSILDHNYRLGNEEVSALALLRQEPGSGICHKWQILDTLVDGRGIRAARAGKKKSPPD